jgi:uncharacterized repeat protein (TIGR01451 family)
MIDRKRARHPTTGGSTACGNGSGRHETPDTENKEKTVKKTIRLRLLAWILVPAVLAAMAILGTPGTASANSTANATVLNVIRVDYSDASGANVFTATASTTVTVNLVRAAATASAPPTGADGRPGLVCLPAGSYTSGSTISSLYALSAAANGADNYVLTMANVPDNVNNVTVAYSALDYTGANPVPNPGSRILGSAIPTRVVDATTLEFPGGALSGFAANDIVLVDIGGTSRAFLVSGVVVGSAGSHSNGGGAPHTDNGVTTAEVKGTLTLAAYANQTLTLNGSAVTFGGGGTAPAFTTGGSIPTLGVPVGEMVLVRIDVTASTTSVSANGAVAYTLTSTNGANTATIACTAGNFMGTTLSITKQVRNVTGGGGFAAGATGNPQDVLEYQVTVANTGGQAAQVVVTDAVPAYTTLVTHAGAYGTGGGTGAAGNSFARISDGTNSEAQPLAPVETGFGNATGITAGSGVAVFVGDTSTNALGGRVPSCSNGAFTTQAACTGGGATWITSYTILYQVRID